MANDSNQGDIPTLRDLIRPGTRAAAASRAEDEPTPRPTAGPQAAPESTPPPEPGPDPERADGARSTGLSDAEIEAIARRVVERQTEQISMAVARAIRQGLALRERNAASEEDDDSR